MKKKDLRNPKRLLKIQERKRLRDEAVLSAPEGARGLLKSTLSITRNILSKVSGQAFERREENQDPPSEGAILVDEEKRLITLTNAPSPIPVVLESSSPAAQIEVEDVEKKIELARQRRKWELKEIIYSDIRFIRIATFVEAGDGEAVNREAESLNTPQLLEGLGAAISYGTLEWADRILKEGKSIVKERER